jgi:glyoxylase-like metal-dependent hydrolase (beta-lactamase superfamily II)
VISSPPARSHLTRDLELDALATAVGWPQPAPAAILILATRFATRGRLDEGFAYFHERAEAEPSQPLFHAFAGQFQLRLLGSLDPTDRPAWLAEARASLDQAVAVAPGLTTYLRGVALAELPAEAGQADIARADLAWVLANRDRLPPGLQRGVDHALARLDGAALDDTEPTFVIDASFDRRDGYRFVPPRLVELAPNVHVAQGFDFSDFAFVVTDDGVVAIDAGTSPEHAGAALRELRRTIDLPITDVIVTHAHWDHLGGLSALLDDGARVVAQAGYAEELDIVNATGVPFRAFFGAEDRHTFELAPDQLVGEPTSLIRGGTRFDLYPVHGGETQDALLVHLPASGVLFTGDVFMPMLGAPFLPEGSAVGLFAAIDTVLGLQPRLLVHGHAPLTDQFTIDILPVLAAALGELHQDVLEGIRAAKTLSELLQRNVLPAVLQSEPAAVVPYLLLRENLVKRVYHQRSGYWMPDGDGIDVPTPAEWAAAVALLADDRLQPFVDAAQTLIAAHDAALALRLVELGLRRFPDSSELRSLRQQALQGLRVLHQQLNPFKFIVYSSWADAELAPVDGGNRR